MRLFILLGWLFAMVSAGLDKSTIRSISNEKSGASKVMKVTDDNWPAVLEGPRDYYLILMLTTESNQFNCVLCNEIKPHYNLVASSFRSAYPQGVSDDDNTDVFFINADFTENKKLFQQLQLTSIPKLYALPPTTSSSSWQNQLIDYQFMNDDHLSSLHRWVQETTGVKFALQIPVDYSKVFTNALLTFAAVIIAIKLYSRVGNVFTSSVVWCALSSIATLLFTTGYMFCQIRNAPYVREYPNGHVDYILKGQSQMQLGAETSIVSFLYGSLSVLVILLIKRVPTITNPSANLVGVATVSAFIFLFYSGLVSLFDMKGMPLPFKLLKLF